MTAMFLKDWFFADEIEALSYGNLAKCIRQAGTHEEVDRDKEGIARIVESRMRQVCLNIAGSPHGKGGKFSDHRD